LKSQAAGIYNAKQRPHDHPNGLASRGDEIVDPGDGVPEIDQGSHYPPIRVRVRVRVRVRNRSGITLSFGTGLFLLKIRRSRRLLD